MVLNCNFIEWKYICCSSCGTVEFGKEVTGQDTPTKLQLSSKGIPQQKIHSLTWSTPPPALLSLWFDVWMFRELQLCWAKITAPYHCLLYFYRTGLFCYGELVLYSFNLGFGKTIDKKAGQAHVLHMSYTKWLFFKASHIPSFMDTIYNALFSVQSLKRSL